MLNHESVLNSLLSNTSILTDYGDYRIWKIQLGPYNEAWIVGKLVPDRVNEEFHYEILGYRLQNTKPNFEMQKWAESLLPK